MTFFELYFEGMSTFLNTSAVLSLLLLIPTLLILLSKTKIEKDMRIFMCISWGLIIGYLTIVGLVRFSIIEKRFDSQLVVNLKDENVIKNLKEAGISCLLIPHENNFRLTTTYIDLSIWPRMQDSPYVVFKNQTLFFFYIDKNAPKQSILDVEETCIIDMKKTLKQQEKESQFKKEQAFLQTISSGENP